jgi:hypothetical protein
MDEKTAKVLEVLKTRLITLEGQKSKSLATWDGDIELNTALINQLKWIVQLFEG